MRAVTTGLFLVAAFSCGKAPQTATPAPPAPAPPGTPPPKPAPGPAWGDVAAIISKDCGGCHNGSNQVAFTSGTVFKASSAKAKLTAGLMPPGGQIAASDKATLLSYLGG